MAKKTLVTRKHEATHQMFSIRDAKSDVFNIPFSKETHGLAERDFTTMTNDPQSPIFKYPEDYDLYHVGTYDAKSGTTESLPTPKHILKAIQVKETSPN